VVEEHEILRAGLVACFQELPFAAVSAAKASAFPADAVDVAVVSSDAARKHAFPCPIVVFSAEPDGPRDVAEGNDVASVVQRESVTVAQLRATVQAAAAGLHVSPKAPGREREDLDARAQRVVQLVAEGATTREIADQMSYSVQTIKKLITTIQSQLDARSRAHMVAVAIRRGLI
jgi:DNA-binding NarL/FixJ family response regulator